LDALRRQTARPREIIVVDNSSTVDGIDDRPAAGHDWRWVRAETNLGFGAACNLGARIARDSHLLFLNADVVISLDACEKLGQFAAARARAGVVGPRLFGADGKIELSARAFPSLATGILGRSSLLTRALALANRAPRAVAGALDASGPVDWVSGACMLIPQKAFAEVGGFDEGYWMYWEDADMCRRLKDLGWGTFLCTEAEARHSTGSSGRSPRTVEAFHHSALRYYERHVARTELAKRLARLVLWLRMEVTLYRLRRRAAR
jgi:GT2 family glycosyltransferase